MPASITPASIAPASIAIHGSCDARFERVRETFQRAMKTGKEIGAAVAFVLDGKSVVDLWAGHYDEARTREWEHDTLVNVYSTTKGMVALCAHQLIERGLLDLDAPVAKYWPEFAAAGKQDVTVRCLLTHQAGLCAVRETLPATALFDWDQMCSALAAQEPWWTPGTAHGYHAFTYGHLVGEVIRRITGESFGTFFRKNVAEPLGADFHVGLAPEHDYRTADMYSFAIGNRTGTPPAPPSMGGAMAEFAKAMQDPTTMQYKALLNPLLPRDVVNSRAWRAAEIPAVNGHATARAIARIYGALARGGEIDGSRILEPETIDRATVEQVAGPERLFCGAVPMRFALGFVLSDVDHMYSRLSPSSRAFGHAGGGGSLGMADPDLKIGFGFTMNCMSGGLVTAGSTGMAVVDAFYEALRLDA